MAYDTDLAERIRAELAVEPDLAEQRMFGGLAFLLAGNMAVAASGSGGMLVRVDPRSVAELIATTAAEPMEMGARIMRGWVHLDAEALASTAALRAWVQRGVAQARLKPPKSG